MNRNVKIILPIFIFIIAVAGVYFVFFKRSENNYNASSAVRQNTPSVQQDVINLEPRINTEAGVTIEVAPLNFAFEKPAQFEITFTTHQGDLDFDLVEQSVLIDDQDKEYAATGWSGGRGGHHISGVLTFSALSAQIKTMKLIIKNVGEIPQREFFWNLR